MSNFEYYLGVEDLGGPRFHPTKNILTFTYDAPGIYQIFSTEVKPNQTSWPEKKTFSKNRCTAARYLSDGTIVFVTDDGGDENFQIGIIDELGQTIISNDPKAKHNISNNSENYLYYSANIDDKSRFVVYRHQLPLRKNKPEKIYSPDFGMVAVSLVSTDEKRLIIGKYMSNTHRDLIILDGEPRNLTESFTPSVWEAVRFLDDDTLLVQTNYDGDFIRPAILTLDGTFRTYEKIEAMNMEFGEFKYKQGSEYTYVTVNVEGYNKLYRAIFTIDGAELIEITLPASGVFPRADQRRYVNAMSINRDESLMAISISSTTAPANIHIIRLDDNSSWQATRASHPGLDRSVFCDATLHRFNSFDGLSVPYFKYLPRTPVSPAGYPTIFMIHGGPEAQYRPSFSPTVQFFLSAGFAVIAPNIRGSSGYGRKYMDMDNKGKRLDSILDIKHLALHLANDTDVDSDKLIIYGGSYGGFAVLSAMTEHPDLWVGGVDIFGISNFVTFLENTAPWRRRLRESEYGSLEEDREMLESISPIHKIENIRVPLFIIQGDNDERVPLSESQQMYDRLVASGLPTEFLRFANEGHGITYLENKLKAYPTVLEWMINLTK